MFRKAIIATDLSAASDSVVQKAKQLLTLGTEEILLLQCIEPMEAFSVAYSETDDKVKKLLQEQKGMLEGFGFKTTAEVVFGSITEEVNRIASERGYSLILIGSKGRSFLKDVLLGGVATRIIQNAEIPTLVLRLAPEGDKHEIVCLFPQDCEHINSRILFATDFSHNAETAFGYVQTLVSMGTRNVDLIHVQDMIKLEKSSPSQIADFDAIDAKRLQELESALVAVNPDCVVRSFILHGKPSVEILKTALDVKPSLIVMGAQGRGFIREAVLGSVSYMVTLKAKAAVLIIPETIRGL